MSKLTRFCRAKVGLEALTKVECRSWGDCPSCHNRVINTGIDYINKVDLPAGPQPGNCVNLNDLLQETNSKTRSVKVRCDNEVCREYGQDIKRKDTFQLTSAPGLLFFQILRFKFDEQEKKITKLGMDVRPEKFIRLEPHHPRGFRTHEGLKEWEPRYRLVGIVYHRGETANSGHYIAAFKHPTKSEWYLGNDKHCRKIKFDDVIENKLSKKGSKLKDCLPYMFAYARAPKGMKKCTTEDTNKTATRRRKETGKV
jgi:hypothetical protein